MFVVFYVVNLFFLGYEYIFDGELCVYGDCVYFYGLYDKVGLECFCDYILKVWLVLFINFNEWIDYGVLLSICDVLGRKDDIFYFDYEFYVLEVVVLNGKYYFFV